MNKRFEYLFISLLLPTFILAGCASKQKVVAEPAPITRAETPTTIAPPGSATQPQVNASVTTTATPPVPGAVVLQPDPTPITAAVKVELKKVAELADNHNKEMNAQAAAESKSAHAANAHASTGAHHAEGVDPDKALGWLKNGNIRFRKHHLRADGQTQKDVNRLSKGQAPHSIILSCSDSRVPPELVFDQKLGEIFVVRTAGEVLDPGALASIEYAVEHLGSRNIVVMGHSNCGAVKAAFSTLEGGDAGSVNLNHLVQDIHPRISSFKGQKPSDNYKEEGWANVAGVAQDLLKRSPLLEKKAQEGGIKIRQGLYSLSNGEVEFK